MLEENYMAALIIRLPDGKRERLKDLARARKQSVTKLFDEMATVMLAEYDAETRFRARAARAKASRDSGFWRRLAASADFAAPNSYDPGPDFFSGFFSSSSARGLRVASSLD